MNIPRRGCQAGARAVGAVMLVCLLLLIPLLMLGAAAMESAVLGERMRLILKIEGEPLAQRKRH